MRLLVVLLLFCATAITSAIAKPPQCPKPPQAPPVKAEGKAECVNGTCGDDCKCFGRGYYCPCPSCKPPKSEPKPVPPPVQQYHYQLIGGRWYLVPVQPNCPSGNCPSPNR